MTPAADYITPSYSDPPPGNSISPHIARRQKKVCLPTLFFSCPLCLWCEGGGRRGGGGGWWQWWETLVPIHETAGVFFILLPGPFRAVQAQPTVAGVLVSPSEESVAAAVQNSPAVSPSSSHTHTPTHTQRCRCANPPVPTQL